MQAYLSSDGSLVARFREGDDDAATVLFERYGQRLYRLAASRISTDLAARFDPDDVLQSVFRSFFRKAGDGTYDAPESGELWGLLALMTIHKVRRRSAHHRADKRSVRQTGPAEELVQLANDDLGEAEARLALQEFLSTLPELDRGVVTYRMSGHSVQEIAVLVGRSKRTVERILQHVRTLLTQALELTEEPR
jgi:RNA polymerase sigma factor (sigma-70 family)